MTFLSQPSTIYTVLGFLEEYAGRRVIQNGDLVEHFFVNEKAQADIFEQYLKRLIVDYQLQTTLRREVVDEHTYFYSSELTHLIDSYYLAHALTGTNPNGTPAYTEGSGFFRKHAGRISEAIFPPNDRQSRLAFLCGAYHRYGEQNAFRFANAFHKAQLIKQLLFDVGSPNVVIIYSDPDRAPALYRVAFEPTPELIAQFHLELFGYE